MKVRKKYFDRLAVIDSNNFCDKHTDGHGDSMTDLAESVKIPHTGYTESLEVCK